MNRPLLLDTFSGAGGAGYGYYEAGFEVIGVDINPQPNFPFEFIQADALEILSDKKFLSQFAVIHASPPCQAYTRAQKLRGNDHPDLVKPVRKLLIASGKPYVIENVPGSPLIDPITLCGASFKLRTYRHRLFESNIRLIEPMHPEHKWKNAKMGRMPKDDEFMHIVGHFAGVNLGREAMGIPWMTQHELAESIPPAYTKYIGKQILLALQKAA